MGDIPDIKNDLPMSMTMSAFAGISCYIGVEINISLFMRFKRRHGLYFWSCALCAWGVILQPLFIILADFDVWTNLKGSITMIYLTWFIMVVPQSWVLYSRLHLLAHKSNMLKWVLAILVFDSVVFSVPTIIMGIFTQATSIDPRLSHVNTIWDRLQTTVFFVQETSLSILYIYQTRRFLRDTNLLQNSLNSPSYRTANDRKPLLYQLIYTNILIIALDIVLLGIQYADLFYLQGAFKPCVYGIKLKVEFVILNRLTKSVRARGDPRAYSSGTFTNSGQGSDGAGRENWLARLGGASGQKDEDEHIVLERLDVNTARRLHSQESDVPIIKRQGAGPVGVVEEGNMDVVPWRN